MYTAGNKLLGVIVGNEPHDTLSKVSVQDTDTLRCSLLMPLIEASYL